MLRAAITFLAVLSVASPAIAQSETKIVKLISVEGSGDGTTRQFFGRVAARETVDLAFQVGGQIIEIPIVEGKPVAKGAVIATLDLEPFELALDQARVNKDQAERTLERLKKLQGNTVSQVSVDDAETQVQLADITLRDAERSLRNAQLVAPFDALVAARNVSNFTTISAGTQVARLHDMSELHIEIDVPEVLFQKGGENPDVELWAQFPASAERFPLEVLEFNAETSSVGQTFGLTLSMAPPENLVVLPGASVTVFATQAGEGATIEIPRAALTAATDGTPMVMLFTPGQNGDGTVAATPISIEPSTNGAVVVTSGLQAGQEIVASGAHLLTDGDSVKRFTGFAN